MKAPGYQAQPQHRIREARESHRVQALVNGEVVANSNDVIRVEEDRSPVRYYFPRSDVKMALLARTERTSYCPFKGTAHYFSVNAGATTLEDAIWTYEDPYEEHVGLKDRLAFYVDKYPTITVRIAD